MLRAKGIGAERKRGSGVGVVKGTVVRGWAFIWGVICRDIRGVMLEWVVIVDVGRRVFLRPSGRRRQAWMGVSGIMSLVCETGVFRGDAE